jgi:LPS export ABC transporter protein LptC
MRCRKKVSAGTLKSYTLFLIPCLLIPFFSACSFEYETAPVASTSQSDLTMEGLEYVHVENGVPTLSFEADRAERWESAQRMELSNVTFDQYTDGEAMSRGGADSISINLASNDVEFSGNVRLESLSEDLLIESPRLSWANQDRHLSSGADDLVRLSQSDGSEISGLGFSASVWTRTWEFSSAVTGTYIDNEQKDDE